MSRILGYRAVAREWRTDGPDRYVRNGSAGPVAAWAALIVVATSASALLMALFFSPMLLIGFGIDAVLLWIVLTRIWQPI